MKQTVTSTASSKASTGPSNVTCFKCGTQGHKSFECKNTKVMITMENDDIETLSEGEYEALVQAAVANEEDYDEESGEDPLLCVHDTSPSLVVTRVLTTQPQAIEDQRCNIFQTRAGIGGKSIKVIIDGGSCHNLASTEMCEKLNLTLRKHPHPYHVQWLSDKGNVKIQHTVTVNFNIGPYEDTVECDVVPMTVCHMLLGLPWQYDNKVIHDGHTNVYTFKVKDKKFELRPMTSSQIITDNAKEFQDVFPDELPHGLPPLRGIEHRIDLIPGAPLPNRAYRTNPEDTKEIQRQIQDLLAKRARVKALHDKVNLLLTTLDLGTPLDGLLPHVDTLCVIRYEVRQVPAEEDTPWSGGGEEQLDVKMCMELDPTSSEPREGRKGASRPRTRSTGSLAGPPGPDRILGWCQPGAIPGLWDPSSVAIRPRARSGPDAPVPGPVGPAP
ncbi:hypothetical protein QYE76_022195 [Lolium multiflorum]|uniref:CCHC-type domain-containing protein n=1 Tax=Lolium multiflorum TaxID=4521 RepID=A0AAD8RC95_LOLMU|nr:hypothetical protein QYE76_022195 [Lolium multiflorum]